MYSRDPAPIEVQYQRLHERERNNMVNTMREERKKRGVPSMLQELGERTAWRGEKILDNSHKM